MVWACWLIWLGKTMGSILSKPVLDLQGKRQKAEHNGSKANKEGTLTPSMMNADYSSLLSLAV